MSRFALPLALALLLALAVAPRALSQDAGAPLVLEGEANLAKTAAAYRDDRASGKRCAGGLFTDGGGVVEAAPELPAGDYEAVFYVEPRPVNVLHALDVTLQAGDQRITLNATHFDGRPGYLPVATRFFHAGGKCQVRVSGKGSSGFDGMRQALSADEKAELGALEVDSGLATGEKVKPKNKDDLLDELEHEKSVGSIRIYDFHLLCDKIELQTK